MHLGPKQNRQGRLQGSGLDRALYSRVSDLHCPMASVGMWGCSLQAAPQ